MNMKVKHNRDRIVAYHEAGHIASAIYFGLPIGRVTIIASKAANGAVSIPQIKAHKMQEQEVGAGVLSAKAFNRLTNEIISTYAGQYALRRLGVRDWKVGAHSDDANAADIADHMFSEDGDACIDAFLKWCRLKTEALMSLPTMWQNVELIANLLIAEKKASAKRVREVIAADARERINASAPKVRIKYIRIKDHAALPEQ